MQEILPGVFTWSQFSERHGYNFNGHMLAGAGGNICIDPVQPSQNDLDTIARIGPKRILITNRNHSRAANLVRSHVSARAAIHEDDAAHARSQGMDIDDFLEAGERVGPLEVVPVPGKSPGEVALLWRERKMLIVGDAVVGNPPGECGLLPEKVMDDPMQLRKSLRALLDLDFDTLLVGDGVSILSGGKDKLKELVQSFPD